MDQSNLQNNINTPYEKQWLKKKFETSILNLT